jgi:hypothetical protein
VGTGFPKRSCSNKNLERDGGSTNTIALQAGLPERRCFPDVWTRFARSCLRHDGRNNITVSPRNKTMWTRLVRCLTNQTGKSHMRTLVISTFAALLFSTGLALAQGSGAAGDIGSGSARGAQSAPAAGGTVGQSAAEPSTAAPAPKAKKQAVKKKKGSE